MNILSILTSTSDVPASRDATRTGPSAIEPASAPTQDPRGDGPTRDDALNSEQQVSPRHDRDALAQTSQHIRAALAQSGITPASIDHLGQVLAQKSRPALQGCPNHTGRFLTGVIGLVAQSRPRVGFSDASMQAGAVSAQPVADMRRNGYPVSTVYDALPALIGPRTPAATQADATLTVAESAAARQASKAYLEDAVKRMVAPMPMRSQLAHNILRAHGLDPEETVNCGTGPSMSMSRLDAYLFGCREVEPTPADVRLPDLDVMFDLAFSAYLDKFREGLAILLDRALSASEAQMSCDAGAEIQLLVPNAVINVRRGLPGLSSKQRIRSSARAAQPQYLRSGIACVARVGRDGSERAYLVHRSTEAGIAVVPVSAQVHDLPDDLFPHFHDLFPDAPPDWSDWPRVQWDFSELRVESCASADPAKPAPVARAVAKLLAEPLAAQREYAYQATGAETLYQAASDFTQGLLPFYACVTEAQAGRIASAAFACAFDAAALLPGLSLASRVGSLGARAGLYATSVAARQANVWYTGGEPLAWQEAARVFANNA